MNKTHINNRIGWLNSALVIHRGRLASILDRLRGFGACACTSFALNRKFTLLLEQVECEKEKERDIICEIEALEKHHQEMKRLKKLRRAEAESISTPMPAFINMNGKKSEKSNLPRLLWFFYMLSSSSVKNKDQRVG